MGKLMLFKVNESVSNYFTYSSMYVREGMMELMGINIVKPSTLIAGAEGSSGELKTAAEILDDKLEKLWEFVAE